MGYLISQIWLCLLIAALLGGIIGWLLRGGCKRQLDALEDEWRNRMISLERERDSLSARLNDFESVIRERDRLTAEVGKLRSIENERDDLALKLAALDSGARSESGTATAKTSGAYNAFAGSSDTLKDSDEQRTLADAMSGGTGAAAAAWAIYAGDDDHNVSNYDIEEIEGIGKGYGKKLRELGIATTANLLEKCPNVASMKPVIEHMKLEDWVIRSWCSMADLMRVHGVDGQFAELLNFSGIQSSQALAKANAAGLAMKMREINEKEHRVKELPETGTVSAWIAHAKTLQQMLTLG
jgi:predicted flap endonuclease-1-like 5' DNA nuclease